MTQLKRNYNTYLTQELANSSTGETPVFLQHDPESDIWFIIIGTWSSQESIFYHRSVGNIVYFYPINRKNPVYHPAGTDVLLANSVDYFNYLLENTEEQFYIYKKNANHLVCKWGTFYVNATNVTVADLDTSLALPNKTLVSNTTNYIYFVEEDFKVTTTVIPLEAYLIATVTVNVWWEITNIVRHNTKIVGNKGEKGDQWNTWPVWPQWPAGANGADGITPTVPKLPTYTFTGWATDRAIDTSTATVAEMFNVMSTMYNDIKAGLQAIGIQWPAGANGTNWIGIPTWGTTGQVLQKLSTTDYDTTWQSLTSWADMFKINYDPTNKNQDIFAYPYSKAEADALLATKQPTIAYTTANDTAVVHKTGNESVSWTKTFVDIVSNSLKITNSPALGKVLTSDNLGNGTWQYLPWASSTYFYLTKTGTDSLPQNTTTAITWNTIRTSSWITLTPTLTSITLPAWVWQIGWNVLRTITPWITTAVNIQLDSSSWVIDTVKLANSSGIHLEQFGWSVTWLVVSTGSTTVQMLTSHSWGGTQITQDICGFWGIKIA